MKVGIVGTGMVGSTTAYALILEGIGREIVLVDKDERRAGAEADDLFHAVPFSHPLVVHQGGYADLQGSKVVVVAAGVSQKPGESRMDLLKRNQRVFSQVIPGILEKAPEAILLIATNPVDVMTHVATKYASGFGVTVRRVLGSGTMLDTARFRALLGRQMGVDPQHVHAYVLGEHGDSEVLAWSLVTVGGIKLTEFCTGRGAVYKADDKEHIDHRVRNAAYEIIDGKGATYYGIGSALAKLIDVILNDRRSIFTVSAPTDDVPGIKNVCVSMPRLIGGDGVMGLIPPSLDDSERSLLRKSAAIVKEASDGLDDA